MDMQPKAIINSQISCAVWMLQTTDIMHVQPRHSNCPAGRGLLSVEQRPKHSVLPVQFVQSWSSGAGEAGLAQHHHPQRHRPCYAHSHLLVWVLCFPKCPPCRVREPIRGKPNVEDQSTMGLLLVICLRTMMQYLNCMFAPIVCMSQH